MIRLVCHRIAPCILVGALSVSAQSRPDVVSTGNGARAIGLSQAVTASVSDVGAIGWNPAGLAHISGTEAMFTARAIGFMVNPESRGSTLLNISVYDETSGALDAIDFVGVAQAFAIGDRRLVAGLAWRRFAEGLQGGGISNIEAQTMFRSTGGTRALSPSIGLALTPRLRVGATANLLSGSSEHVEDRSTTTYDVFVRELDQSGTALDVGAQYELAVGLRIGVLATLPHELAMRYEQDTVLDFVRDTTQLNVTRTAPLAFAVGFELETSPSARVSADLRSADWSTSTLRDDATGEIVPSPVGRFATHSVHVGYEWDRHLAVGITTATRIGAHYRQSSVADSENKPITEIGASLGRSWQRSRFAYDFSLAYSRSSSWARAHFHPAPVTASDQQLTAVFGVRWKR